MIQSGQRYERLTIIGPTKERYRRSILWEALCECGNTTKVISYKVENGLSKSCGCLSKEAHIYLRKHQYRGGKKPKHNHARKSVSPTYSSWLNEGAML